MTTVRKSPKAFSDIVMIGNRIGIQVNLVDLSNKIVDDIYGFINTGETFGDIDTAVDYELLCYLYSDLMEGIMDIDLLDEEAVITFNELCEDLYKYFINIFKSLGCVCSVQTATLNYVSLREIKC